MPLFGLDDDIPDDVAEQGDDPVEDPFEPDEVEPEVAETNPADAVKERNAWAAMHVPPAEDDEPLEGDDG